MRTNLRRLTGGLRLAGLALNAPVVARTMLAVRRDKLTYLELAALADLADAARTAEAQQRPGVFIEAGCALGGSALVLAAAKSAARPFYIYDTFETIPPPTSEDGADAHRRFEVIAAGQAEGIAGEKYYGYQDDLLGRVTASFERYDLAPATHAVQLVKGLFEDTLTGHEPVALAHLDCDWYASVLTCLENIVPRLAPGGVLVFDDYNAWSGCHKAVDAYFAGRRDEFDWHYKARLHIVKR